MSAFFEESGLLSPAAQVTRYQAVISSVTIRNAASASAECALYRLLVSITRDEVVLRRCGLADRGVAGVTR